jgi:hypothetical protein
LVSGAATNNRKYCSAGKIIILKQNREIGGKRANVSYWQEYDLEEKITRILTKVERYNSIRPFLTAYQVAIEFAHLYPEDFARLNYPVGGKGIGQRNSLAQYLAKQLSTKIGNGHITHIEISFLCNDYLNEITFNNNQEIVTSSLTDTRFPLSMFRLRNA